MAGVDLSWLIYGLAACIIVLVIYFLFLREPRKPKPQHDAFCPFCKGPLDWVPEADRWYCKVCVRWYSISENDRLAREYAMRRKRQPKVELITEKQEPIPPPPSPSPKEDKEPIRVKFKCNNCGKSFWIHEHRIKIPYCKECGAPNPSYIKTSPGRQGGAEGKYYAIGLIMGLLMTIIGIFNFLGPLSYLLIIMGMLTLILSLVIVGILSLEALKSKEHIVKFDEIETLPPPPPPSKKGYKSQFLCKACERAFWVYEHRFKVPYCQECGAPDPVHVITVGQE